MIHPHYLRCWQVLIFLFLVRIVCHLSEVKPCASSLDFLSFGPFTWVSPLSILGMVPSILQERLPSCLSIWWDFYCRTRFRKVSSFIWRTLFFFPFLLHLFWWCFASNIPQYLIIFFFSRILILDFVVLLLLLFIFFPLFFVNRAPFSKPNSIPIFWLYILNVRIRVPNSFHFLKTTSFRLCS